MSNLFPVFPQLGVHTKKGDSGSARLILSAAASTDQKKLQILNDTGKTEEHDTDAVTVNPVTARMRYEAGGDVFHVREPRENDGSWLSKYKVSLPLDAIRAFAIRGDNMNPDESLQAYATDDSPYIVGLVYSNGVGQWARVDQDWVMLAPDDDSFDDMNVIDIDPDRAQDFIGLYDSNYVSVQDAQQYESAESDDDSEPDSSDDTDSDTPSDNQ